MIIGVCSVLISHVQSRILLSTSRWKSSTSAAGERLDLPFWRHPIMHQSSGGHVSSLRPQNRKRKWTLRKWASLRHRWMILSLSSAAQPNPTALSCCGRSQQKAPPPQKKKRRSLWTLWCLNMRTLMSRGQRWTWPLTPVWCPLHCRPFWWSCAGYRLSRTLPSTDSTSTSTATVRNNTDVCRNALYFCVHFLVVWWENSSETACVDVK